MTVEPASSRHGTAGSVLAGRLVVAVVLAGLLLATGLYVVVNPFFSAGFAAGLLAAALPSLLPLWAVQRKRSLLGPAAGAMAARVALAALAAGLAYMQLERAGFRSFGVGLALAYFLALAVETFVIAKIAGRQQGDVTGTAVRLVTGIDAARPRTLTQGTD